MKIMFLDESGDHNLLIVDKDYPIFVLGGGNTKEAAWLFYQKSRRPPHWQ
ncbi:MAG: DUF3800 domain-containing protein [Candidatus Omnitrophota bacterium]